jgi:hypothetical protein
MATEFKRKTMADVVTTALPNTSNANSDLYTVPVNCDTVIIGLLLTNKSGASVVADVMIEVQSGQGENVYLIKGAQVPVGSALEVISGKVVVANTAGSGVGDTLQVRCDVGSSLDATVSILENT